MSLLCHCEGGAVISTVTSQRWGCWIDSNLRVSSVFILHVLPASERVPSRYSSFLPSSNDTPVRATGTGTGCGHLRESLSLSAPLVCLLSFTGNLSFSTETKIRGKNLQLFEFIVKWPESARTLSTAGYPEQLLFCFPAPSFMNHLPF